MQTSFIRGTASPHPPSDVADLLTIRSLCKSFPYRGAAFNVLDGINCNANRGEFVCILGPSGCGKTVLLYLVAGFLQPSAGEVLVDGARVREPSPDRAMVFQDYVLFPWKTAAGNVAFGLEHLKHLDKAERSTRVETMLRLVGLEDFADWPIHKLSGGMQQRVATARALIMNPKLLLMDEPFSALDPRARRELRQLLSTIWERLRNTVLFVTHSVKEAVFLADCIYVMGRRPSTIRRHYVVTLPRPRQVSSPEFYKLHEEIESAFDEEARVIAPSTEPDIDELTRLEL